MPRGAKKQDPVERFLKFVEKDPITGCWLWLGCKSKKGYGRFQWHTGQSVQATHAAFILFIGPIPVGCDILHSCDNPPCVNPQHLFPGTNLDNVIDRCIKGRTAKGEKKPNAVIEESFIPMILKDPRTLREIAQTYSVTHTTILRIKHGTNWKHAF